LGSSWQKETGEIQYYIDHVLPFGLRSSAVLFNKFADGLEFVMKQCGWSVVLHYLDDYFTCGPAGSDVCEKNLVTMIHTCDALGLPVNPKKTMLPSTWLEFLGIEIDNSKMELSQRMVSE
jgi:hypothetical protein